MKRILRGRFALWSVFLCLIVAPADPAKGQIAFEGSLPDSVIVTTTSLPSERSLSVPLVTLLNRQALAGHASNDLSDQLRRVPGLDIQQRGTGPTQADWSIQGAGFNGTAVLVDHAPFNDPMTGHFLSDQPFTPSALSRVEVLHGAASAAYGPGAVGGVVHLLTPLGTLQAGDVLTRAAESSLRLSAGSFGLLGTEVSSWHTWPRFAVQGHLQRERADGHVLTTSTGRIHQDATGTPLRGDVDRTAGSVGVYHPLGALALFVQAAFDDRAFGAFHYYTPFSSDTAREATHTRWVNAQLVGARARMGVAYRYHDDAYRYNPRTPTNEHETRRLIVFGDFPIFASHQLDFGSRLHALSQSIESNSMGSRSDWQFGLAVWVHGRPSRWLQWYAASRVDRQSVWGTVFTPEVRLSLQYAHWTARLALGQSLRPPTYVEQYFNTARIGVTSGNLGNPALIPEKAQSATISLSREQGALSVNVSAFARVTDNLIDFVQPDASTALFTATNVLNVSTRGFTAQSRWEPSDRWRMHASWTGQRASVSSPQEVYAYKYASLLRPWTALVSATMVTGAVRWSPQLDHFKQASGEVVTLVGLTVGYLQRRTTINVAALNLTDAWYADLFDAPLPGRHYRVTWSISI